MKDALTDAYLEAVVFTDFGDEDQPPIGTKFSPLAIAEAWRDAHNFMYANKDLLGDNTADSMMHDLWLTRNGHGTGFWDRPEKWGENASRVLTRCAHCMGEVWTSVGDDGLVYFSR
jgi:hypothetical protein